MYAKKMKVIQMRPEPPEVDSVRHDLEKAPNDDVAFTFFLSVSKQDDSASANLARSTSLESSKDILKSSLATELPSSASTSPSRKMRSSDLDHCYNQTLRFIQMNEYLKHSQDGLADQCTELQNLGLAVKEQVESLRTPLS